MTSAGNIAVHKTTPAMPPQIHVLNIPISSLVFPGSKIFSYNFFSIINPKQFDIGLKEPLSNICKTFCFNLQE